MLRSTVFIILRFFVLWSSLPQAQPNTTPILNLRWSLYGCSQPRLLEIFGMLSLKNCFSSTLQQEVHVCTFREEILQYSPVASTFPIYYCTLEAITMTCTYYSILAQKQRRRNFQSVLVPGWSSLQARLNYTVQLCSATHSKILWRRLTIVTTAKRLPINIRVYVVTKRYRIHF